MPNTISALDLLDIEQAAEHLHLSRAHLYRLTSQRKVPHFKVRGRVVFDRHKLDAWVAGFEVATR